MVEVGNECNILVGKLEGKRLLGDIRANSKIILKWSLKK
jgi:hypothetical protein